LRRGPARRTGTEDPRYTRFTIADPIAQWLVHDMPTRRQSLIAALTEVTDTKRDHHRAS
jgi:hypothetical protein